METAQVHLVWRQHKYTWYGDSTSTPGISPWSPHLSGRSGNRMQHRQIPPDSTLLYDSQGNCCNHFLWKVIVHVYPHLVIDENEGVP